MTRHAGKLYIVRDPDGDHAKREFADIYLGDQVIGGLFCSPEQLAIMTSLFNSHNKALDEGAVTEE